MDPRLLVARCLLLASALWLPAAAVAPRPVQDATARRIAAEQLWQQGRRHESLEALAALLEGQPGDAELRRTLAERQIAVHRTEAALLTLQPLGPEVRDLRARALYVLARYDEALPLLRDDDPIEAVMLVDALEALGRLDEADTIAARVVDRQPDADPRLRAYQARRAAQRGDHARALELFDEVLARDPLDLASCYGRGQSLLRLGRREEGLAALERHREIVPRVDAYDFALRAVDLDPVHGPNLAGLADTERALGMTDQALGHYRQAYSLADGEQLTPITLRYARLLVEDLGDVDQAVTLLDGAATRRPDPRLAVRAGDVLLAAGRPAEAEARYEQALALLPGDARIVARRDRARQEQRP